MTASAWLAAIRLRTLPLALASIVIGGTLATLAGNFKVDVFLLCCLTTVLLQILSNLANDYGDSVHGADHAGRLGPKRAVQTGSISKRAMQRAIIAVALLCFAVGVSLLFTAFGTRWQLLIAFLGIGLLAIGAAITYTMGKRPYGYAGLGDLSVFIFFGLVGVCGSEFLFTHTFHPASLLPAGSCGLLAVAVLNINNMRDIDSDRQAGKISIPVRIGLPRARQYHLALLTSAVLLATVYVFLHHQSWVQYMFWLSTPLLAQIGQGIVHRPPHQLDPLLKKQALAALLFAALFCAGHVL